MYILDSIGSMRVVNAWLKSLCMQKRIMYVAIAIYSCDVHELSHQLMHVLQ